MEAYQGDKIRNVCLLGHSGAGKTSLVEAILDQEGYIDFRGTIDQGNTVSDFTKEEIDRRMSLSTSLIPIERGGLKINFLDTPGGFDFVGELSSSLAACEGVILLVDGARGIEVGTEKIWKEVQKKGKPCLVFVNKMDREDLDMEGLIKDLEGFFKDRLALFNLPLGLGASLEGVHSVLDENDSYLEDLRLVRKNQQEIIREKVAETDEVLLEKYFNEEDFSREERDGGIKKAMVAGDLVPLVFGSAEEMIGIGQLLDLVDTYLPGPDFSPSKVGEGDFSGLVFKTIVDPFVGKLSMFKVLSGVARKDMDIYNSSKEVRGRMGQLLTLRGENQIRLEELGTGDIGLTSKLGHTQTGDILSSLDNPPSHQGLTYPDPVYFAALEARDKGEEDKLGLSLSKLVEEDPSLVIERKKETGQLILGGQGNMQLDLVMERLKNTFDLEVDLLEPEVAYRETIRGRVEVEGRHKKQSGGAGQYGHVQIRLEPTEEDFVFEEEVFGGAVPRNFFPAVEKGLMEALERGVLGGYPVVNVRATLFDGSYHPVDSNDMAFKLAAGQAFKEGMKKAQPVLLEPIMELRVLVPEAYMGDVMGDMTKRRGKILGMEPREDGEILIIGEAPQAELFSYALDLRSMTQARGDFTLKLLGYEELPREMEDRILRREVQEV